MHHNFSFRAIREQLGTQALLAMWGLWAALAKLISIHKLLTGSVQRVGCSNIGWSQVGYTLKQIGNGLRSGWIVVFKHRVFPGILLSDAATYY